MKDENVCFFANLLRIPMMAAEMAVVGASPDGDLWCVFCVFGGVKHWRSNNKRR